MHIDLFKDVINACRFCFMCRHLATIANVTFRECDIPRGRALILDRVRMHGIEELRKPDHIRTIYDCALSGACRTHCVSHYDEPGLVLAARRDIVEAGLAPDEAKALADAIAAKFAPEISGDTGDVLYLDATAHTADQPEIAAAFGKIMDSACIPCRTLRVNDTGKAAAVLGFSQHAARMAGKVREAIAASACRTVVASCPAAFDALKNDYTRWGAPLENVDVQHSSTYLLGLIEQGRLKVKPAGKTGYYIDSDFLRNYNDIVGPPRALLEAWGYSLKRFGTNAEESYAMGEGAVVLNELRPELVRRLREYVVALMDSPDDLLITASPYTRRVLDKLGGRKVHVISVEEAVAG